MFKKLVTKFIVTVLMIATVISGFFGVLAPKAEAKGHYEHGIYVRSFVEKLDYALLKGQIRKKDKEAKEELLRSIDSGDIDEKTAIYIAKQQKKADKEKIEKRAKKAEQAAVYMINFLKQEDKNWAGFAFDASKVAVHIIAECFVPGGGAISDAVFGIVDALLPGASPLSETAELKNRMLEEFGNVEADLTEIKAEIAGLSKTINDESNRVISAVSSQLDALDARQYVRNFTFSGEGNFSYNQFSNFIYGSSDLYYNQAYYIDLLEAIVNGEPDEVLKEKYDNLYSALMSTAANGDSNYRMLCSYLGMTGDDSVSQRYYDYISSNPQLLNDDQSAEEQALEYAKEKYFTALEAGALIQTCNAYQLVCMMEEYGYSLNDNSRYYFNQNTGEYITYRELVQNVEYVANNRDALMQCLLKDIAYITNMGSSYLVEEENGEIYVVTNYNEATFGQVVSGQKIYLNQVYEELIGDISGCEPYDFHYYCNGQEITPEFTVGNSDFSVFAFYKDTQLFKIDFHVGATDTFNGGDGSAEYPYNISNAAQLNLISDDLSANYRLIKEIDCNGVAVSQIGNAGEHFTGMFDGNGYAIKNLSLTGSSPTDQTKPLYVGLFGFVEGTIKNLTLTNVTVDSDYLKDGVHENGTNTYFYIGILAGCNEGLIDNCVIQNSSLTVDRHNEVLDRNITVCVGGFAGSNFRLIQNCSLEGVSVDAKSYHSYKAQEDADNKNYLYVGGIAGESLGYIANCRVDSATKLTAFAESYCDAKMTTKYPYINVYVGGIAAIIDKVEYIQNVYSATDVKEPSYLIKNNGSGTPSTKHCVPKGAKYVPFKTIDGLSGYADVVLPGHAVYTAEVSSTKTVPNGVMYLDYEDLAVTVDGNAIDDFEIIGLYGFDARNTSTLETIQNHVIVVFSCEIDGETVILSDSLDLTIAENELVDISVEGIYEENLFEYGDADLSGKTVYVACYYSAGNCEVYEITDYTINFIGEQTSLNYGDNRVLFIYQGLDCEYVIHVDCNHSFAYETVEATCAHAGYVYKKCTLCGEEVSVSYTEKLTRHDLITIEAAQAATCTQEGSTGRVYCEECGYEFVQESSIPKTKHTYEYVDATEHACSVCGHAEAHQYTVSEALNELCQIVYTYKCYDCGYSYTETDINTITAAANALPTLAVSDGFALQGGDLVTVYVQLLNISKLRDEFGDPVGITGANFGIRYDERLILDPLDPETGVLDNGIMPSTVNEPHQVNCGWNFIWGAAPPTYQEGDVLTLTFRVPYDAEPTDKFSVYVVYGLIPDSEGGILLGDGKTMQRFATRAGTISMVDHLPGDANDDGIVDLMDAVYTARYLVNNGSIDKSYADVNLDGIVDLRDVVHSLRSLLGGYGTNFMSQKFEIILNTNGADVQYDNLVVSLYDENNIYELPTPTRRGYTFLGWNTRIYGDDGQFIKDGDSVRYDNNQLTQTLYARWKPNSVSFDVDGAISGEIDPVTYSTSNTSVVLPEPEKYYSVGIYYGDEYLTTKTFTFAFQHWLNEETGRSYNAGQTYSLKDENGGDVILKAIWETTPVVGEIATNRPGYEFGGYYYKNPEVKPIIDGDPILDEEEAKALEAWIKSTNPPYELFTYFNPITYTVTLDANGGTCGESEMSVTYHSEYSDIIVPTRKGYVFAGWYIAGVRITDNAGKIISGTDYFKGGRSAITSDCTAVAGWTVLTYTVTFDKQFTDAVLVSGDMSPREVEFDAKYGTLPTLTKTGYDFDGWFTAQDGGTQVTGETAVSTARDHTLYAHWTAKTFTVTFDANGGECTIPSKSVTYDGKYGTLPEAPTVSKVGYSFSGWFTTPKTGGVKINADTDVKLTENQTLYARFYSTTYDVTLDPNGGECGTTKITVPYDEEYGTLPTPTRTGYGFNGWFTAREGGEQVTAATIVTTAANHALYAQWKLLDYTVTLELNDDSLDPATCSKPLSFTIHYGDKFSQLPNDLTRTGYTCSGWFTAQEGGTEVKQTDTFNSTTNITLYAHWTKNEITVTFVADNGLGDSQQVKVKYRERLDTSAQWTKTGYTFLGWFTDENGTGVQITDKDRNLITNSANAAYIDSNRGWIYLSDITLYPKWGGEETHITLDWQGGTGGTTSVDAIYGSAMPSITAPSRTGYTFGGYYTGANGTGTQYYTAGGASARSWNLNTKTITLYAKWIPNTYKVTFDQQGGSGGTTEKSATYASAMPSITIPSRTGYTFGGYYTETNGNGTQYYTAGGASARNWDKTVTTTLYAKWIPNEYKITFDQKGGTGGTTEKMATYASAMPSITIPTFTGHIFGGYYTGTNGTGTQYYTASGASARNWDKTVATTLYAKWTAETYTIHFDKNLSAAIPEKVSGAASDMVVTYGQNVTLPTLSCEYCTFNGWLIGNSSIGATSWQVTDCGKDGATITLQASWRVNVTRLTNATGLTPIISNPSGTYVLIEDIDLSGGFNPIDELAAGGILDGNGHEIKNWTYTRGTSEYKSKSIVPVGLFKANRGTIKDLTLENITIDVDARVDSMSRFYVGALCGSNYGTIEYVVVRNSSIKGLCGTDSENNLERAIGVGGLVGAVYSGDIHHCGASNNYIHAWIRVHDAYGYAGGAALIGAIRADNKTSNFYDLFANDNTIFCDGHGGSGKYGLGLTWSGDLFIYPAGFIGLDAKNCQTLTRLVSVNNTLTWENTTNHGVVSGQYHRYANAYCYGSTPADAHSYASLSDVTFDSIYDANGWRKSAADGEISFVRNLSKGLAFTSNGNGTCSVTGLGSCTDTELVIPSFSPAGDRVTSIGDSAFLDCTAITSVVVPDTVIAINQRAFRGCTGLEQILFSKDSQLTTIGFNVFSTCTSLKSIEFPRLLTSVGNYLFVNCTSLESITVAEGNTKFTARGNCLIESGYCVRAGCKTSVIPNDGTITSISVGAFAKMISNDFVIPASVQLIKEEAFNGCQMASLTFAAGSQLTSLEGYVLINCTSLTSITFGGTKAQWNAVTKGTNWNQNTGNYTVYCTDGNITK